MTTDDKRRSITIPLPSHTSVSYIFIALLVVASFLIGSLYTKVQMLEKDQKAPTAENNVQGAAAAPQEPKLTGAVPEITKDDHVRGDINADYALIEYSDFECPYCSRFHPSAQQFIDTYKDVVWVYRHFPLSIHLNSQISAEASECAAELGGEDMFWNYADLLFQKVQNGGSELVKDKLITYATEAGLDSGAFQNCLESGKYTQEIKDEMNAGAEVGIQGTPGNILLNRTTGDTKLIPGAVPYDQLVATFEDFRK